ncbi:MULTISPECIES: flavin reductase family protein [Thalassospira]|jgi:flavin reductase (DIM6/NTAB) family NADH-FMN oxidoreductase RutF|uniref:Flavin reductase n=1 Tax=Thalassospira profundimaris TaxID=502049 RepID=A0A367V5V8_9PROT|nr:MULTISPECIES: flavin reductase family protein [Thalassospira]KZB72847.1 flavin reductase [Thalassospira sp. MCCC 1A01148]MBR9900054.1 flavin reductase family protein [Rhodospirillales bacterium]MBS8272878.1 flavin reductase [Thalassospira tepidiphila]RCK20533.1 flavin reductase [Thalassospira profundimaris]|tara:strand:- start:1045 stop:1527 length:483 start_codon:yes stop_codon:yes gene_type:complete
MSFSPRDFRDCLGQFTTGVAVVTTRTADGAKAGITINSFASVSLEPALVLFSVDHRAATHALFTGDATRFCINILSQDQKQVSELFSAPGQDGWEKVAYEDDSLGMPRLTGSVAAFTCERHALHEGGDHSIIVGHVRELVMGETGAPLLYYGGRYRALGD